jgi:hypothetical protein
VPARKSFPIARKTPFNETASDIGVTYKALSDNTVSISWWRLSIARGARTHLDAAHPLAFHKSP